MVFVNCDMGERGPNHPVDLALMNYIGMANIACGGHAGDPASVEAFTRVAREKGVKVSAHLSYPDRAGFGRSTMTISPSDLVTSLDSQMDLMPAVKTVKLHGALYNDANVDPRLAATLAAWMRSRGITEVVTVFDSHLAAAARSEGISVIREAFAERRYAYDGVKNQLRLVDRRKAYALIKDRNEAVIQSMTIVNRHRVTAFVEDAAGRVTTVEVPIEADTLCIHSDSEIALALARDLASLLR